MPTSTADRPWDRRHGRPRDVASGSIQGGRTPLPEGRGRRLFLLAFVVVPPIALGGISALPTYVAIIAALAILMWIAAMLVGQVAHGDRAAWSRSRSGDPSPTRTGSRRPGGDHRAGRERAGRRQGQRSVPAGPGVPDTGVPGQLPRRLGCPRRRHPVARGSDRERPSARDRRSPPRRPSRPATRAVAWTPSATSPKTRARPGPRRDASARLTYEGPRHRTFVLC